MSNVADYYAPDETPVERDPTEEEMMTTEERLLTMVKQLKEYQPMAPFHRFQLSRIEDYFKQAIARMDRAAEQPCDVDADFLDPFSDEQPT